MRHLLPPKAKADLLAGAHVCRHCEGCWNSISDDTLPNGFHGKISNQVKTMEQLKRGIKVGGKTVFDLEAIFIRLLIVV